ncbi:transposase [Peribacillus sp. NPDC097295]|uniref:transposase n=1 Tax=Peribacillus sp. NPDC097295 TaxID=3364402 RepID=UPI003820B32A
MLSTRTDKIGFTRDFKIYECEECTDCPLKAQCTKATGNLEVHVYPVYEELKAKAKVNLWSESNAQIYARRKIEIRVFLVISRVIGRSVTFCFGA